MGPRSSADDSQTPTVTAVTPCTELETRYGLTHGRMVAWNPTILSNCEYLTLGYDSLLRLC